MWYVLEDVQTVSSDQLLAVQQYTNSYDGAKENSANALSAPGNNRRTQALNTRKVYRNVDPSESSGASALLSGAAATLALAAALAF